MLPGSALPLPASWSATTATAAMATGGGEGPEFLITYTCNELAISSHKLTMTIARIVS